MSKNFAFEFFPTGFFSARSMAGAGKGSKSGDVKESTDSSTTIEEDEKGKQIKICKVIDDYLLVNPGMDNFRAGLLREPVLGRRQVFYRGSKTHNSSKNPSLGFKAWSPGIKN